MEFEGPLFCFFFGVWGRGGESFFSFKKKKAEKFEIQFLFANFFQKKKTSKNNTDKSLSISISRSRK